MIAVSGSQTNPAVAPRLQACAFAALCFLAFFSMTDLGGQFKPEYGAILATLLLIPAWRAAWPELLRQPVARWLAVFVVFAIAHAAYAAVIFPSLSFSKQMSAAAEPVRLAVFSCVVGWWLSLMPRRAPLLFALMIAGLLIAVVAYMPWLEMPQIWGGRIRPRFGMPENLGGLLAALGGWLSLCLLLKLWNAHGRFGRRRGLIVLCLLAYVISFSALLFSQSRGAWLAFAATLPAVALGLGYWWKYGGRTEVPWLPLLCVGALSLLLVVGGRDIVAKRFAGADRLLPEVAEVADGGAHTALGAASFGEPALAASAEAPAAHADSDANNQAVSARMALYRFGMASWKERPLLGWGLRTTSVLIADSGLVLDGQRHAHLHNAYLDTLVGIGLVGACLLGAFLLLTARELWMAWRCGIVTNAGFAMVAGCVGIVLVANSFDSLVWRYDYTRAPLEIVFGCCIAYGLIRRRRAAEAVSALR
ncbi:MAG TPA: O-antigen ligase family protein [Luteimonas sp.]|nr:O-antigen ligase family protein [Luteimonas sp.]